MSSPRILRMLGIPDLGKCISYTGIVMYGIFIYCVQHPLL